jgi:hypothetical protein
MDKKVSFPKGTPAIEMINPQSRYTKMAQAMTALCLCDLFKFLSNVILTIKLVSLVLNWLTLSFRSFLK